MENHMSEIPDHIDWSLTSWEGSRRAQLRRWRAPSLRQKLLALEEMTEIAEHFGRMRETGKMRGPTTPKQQT
jgi:CRISPR-associated protein Csx17